MDIIQLRWANYGDLVSVKLTAYFTENCDRPIHRQQGASVADSISILDNFLAGAFNLESLVDTVARYVHADATYVSLNFDNPELAKIEPWCGTKNGRKAFISNFSGVLSQWDVTSFEPEIRMSDGGKAMVFGRFSLRSKTLGIEASSPMCAIATIINDQIAHFIYLEDTFATASTFRASGEWTFSARVGEDTFTI